MPLRACLSCFAVRLDDSTTQIILATLAPYSGERNFYEICRALALTHAPTEWRPTHAPSTSGIDSPEAGAPDELEITPEMIEAGASQFFDGSGLVDLSESLALIYAERVLRAALPKASFGRTAIVLSFPKQT